MAREASPNDNAAAPLSAKARDWREGRRLRALELLALGYRASEVARVLGVSPGAVSQWSKRAKAGGAEALFRKKRHGRSSRLDAKQLTELRLALTEAASSNPWTTREVAAIIAEKWGVRYSRAHVSRIVKALRGQVATRGNTPLPQLTSA